MHQNPDHHNDAGADRPLNSYWLQPGALLAGEYPGAASPAEARRKLGDFLDRGISAFLDLTEAGELKPYEALLTELAQARGIDFAYRRMAIRDVDVPETPLQMRAILDQIHQWLQQGHRIYFHCWGGVGRTGTVAGCHLVDNGLSGEASLEQLRLLWTHMSEEKRRRKPHTPETRAQRDYVLGWNEMSNTLYAKDCPDELV